jgi:hypothetical protein
MDRQAVVDRVVVRLIRLVEMREQTLVAGVVVDLTITLITKAVKVDLELWL